MDILLQQSLIESWLFVFARLLGWAWIDPLLGRLPWSLRLLAAGTLAWVWVPALPAAQIDPFTTAGLIGLILSFLTGAVMGFAARLLLAVAEAALSIVGISATMGLTRVVPEQEAGFDAVLQALAWWLALLAFFSANGHLLVIQAMGTSFVAIPPTAYTDALLARELAEAGGLLLAAAVQLSLPLLVLVLLSNLAFAVLSRIQQGVDGFSTGLTMGAFALLAGLAMAVPLLVSGLGGLFVRSLPQLLP